jgi:hypothetical protein
MALIFPPATGRSSPTVSVSQKQLKGADPDGLGRRKRDAPSRRWSPRPVNASSRWLSLKSLGGQLKRRDLRKGIFLLERQRTMMPIKLRLLNHLQATW